jgi:RNA polymerase sigma-70 factor, ECF subfamily
MAGEAISLAYDVTLDEVGFTGLVERNSRFVFRVANAVLRNPQDAEDIAQETFLKLYRTGAWKRMEDEKAFLARTAWRLAVGRTVKRRDQSLDADHSGIPSGTASPESEAVASAERILLRRLIEGLDDSLRLPLVLSAIEELNSRQIAQVMGIPEGTVRTRLQRARTELKLQFEAMKGAGR